MDGKRAVAIAGTAIALCAGAVWAREAPPSPYAGEEHRPIKALSPQEIEDLRAGNGMGFSKVAELNHYPGPRHVLDLAQPLRLTPEQQRRIEGIHTDMREEAQRLGRLIIDKEAELERLFATRSTQEERMRALTADIGSLRAELRWTHVRAHLLTARALSSEQVREYDRLRGYTEDARSHHHHRH